MKLRYRYFSQPLAGGLFLLSVAFIVDAWWYYPVVIVWWELMLRIWKRDLERQSQCHDSGHSGTGLAD